MPVSEYALLIDTNIFNRMIAPNGDAFCDSVFRQIQGPIIPWGHTMWDFITPFLVMEVLGITFPECRHEEVLAKLISQDAQSITQEVVTLLEDTYSQLPELSEAHFRERFERLNGPATATGKALLRDVIGKRIDRQHIEILIKNLALDFHYGFPYHKKLRSKEERLRVHINFLLDVCSTVIHQSHLSPARGMFEVTETLRKKNQNILSSLRDLLTQKNGLKLYGDRGDLDIVHLVVMGAFLNGEHKRVLAVTGDDPVQVKRRIAGYKNLVHHFLNQLRGSRIIRDNPEFEAIGLHQGLVLILDQGTGQIIELVNVEQIPIHD